MKKTFLAVIFLVLVKVTFAQYDPKALEILEAMGEKYKSIPTYEANFSYALTNDVENIKEEFKGKLTVKGDKYRISLPEQEVINNGGSFSGTLDGRRYHKVAMWANFDGMRAAAKRRHLP